MCPHEPPFLRGSFRRCKAGDRARPQRGPPLRDSAGISPDFASSTPPQRLRERRQHRSPPECCQTYVAQQLCRYHRAYGCNRKARRGLQPEDPTLTELMRLLQSTDSAYRESEIISRLRGSGCSAVLIRRAIVAAVTVGLARRVRYPGWTAELLTGAFGLGERTSAGHRNW